MNMRTNHKSRPGVVLLAVLILIMVITVLSLGFLSRSDVELACGRNMVLRGQMDYLAESGLEQAKGLILNPQDVQDEYYTGAAGLQLVDGGSEYYDVFVEQDSADRCNYTIDSNAYEMRDDEKVGQSNLRALLRLDPCIALWSGVGLTLTDSMTVNGDVYCNGVLSNLGTIDGDVFADSFSGQKTGQLFSGGSLSLVWPEITVDDFDDKPGVTYYSDNYTLSGDIEGMLLVNGDLSIQEGLNLTITASKNLPALYVTGDLYLVKNSVLNINGLAVVDGRVFLDSGTNINQLGGLFAKSGIFEIARDNSVNDTVVSLYNGVEKSEGKYNGGLKFDGNNDYAGAKNESLFDIRNQITVAAWIKVSSFDKDFQAIVTKGDTAWRLQRYSNKKKIEFACSGLTINSFGNIWTNKEITDSGWHHVAGVYNGSAIKIYIDGVLDVSTNTTGLISTNNYNVQIGKNAEQANRNWNGWIDDVQIYNRGLDPNEIVIIKSGFTVSGPNLVAHWKFDETGSEISITAAPEKAAIIIPDGSENGKKWGQAAGAFYKSIERR